MGVRWNGRCIASASESQEYAYTAAAILYSGRRAIRV
jgi:hypothetical protein